MNRAPLVVSLVVLVASGSISCKAAPKPFPDDTGIAPAPVRVSFEPPVNVDVVERSVHTRSERAGDGPELAERVTATLRSRFEPTETGYELTQRVSEVVIDQNGTTVESELAQLVTKFPIRVRLAKDGTFVELLNAGEIEDAIRAAIPDPAQAEAVLQYFTTQAIEQQSRAEWASKYGELLARDVVGGQTWYSVESLATTRGELHYVLERTVKGTRQGEGGRELVIDLSCPQSVEAAADAEAVRQALEAGGSPGIEPSIQCAGQQVVGLEPFIPRATQLEVRAAPKSGAAQGMEILFTRTVTTEQVE